LTLLDTVLARVREEYAGQGKLALFEALQVYLSGDRGVTPYSEISARLGLGESAMKMAVLRLRRRFGEMLRAEIAQTVTRPEEIDEEIRSLFGVDHLAVGSADHYHSARAVIPTAAPAFAGGTVDRTAAKPVISSGSIEYGSSGVPERPALVDSALHGVQATPLAELD
jgi:hypothetical protein